MFKSMILVEKKIKTEIKKQLLINLFTNIIHISASFSV